MKKGKEINNRDIYKGNLSGEYQTPFLDNRLVSNFSKNRI
jgi:hypothetical protein